MSIATGVFRNLYCYMLLMFIRTFPHPMVDHGRKRSSGGYFIETMALNLKTNVVPEKFSVVSLSLLLHWYNYAARTVKVCEFAQQRYPDLDRIIECMGHLQNGMNYRQAFYLTKPSHLRWLQTTIQCGIRCHCIGLRDDVHLLNFFPTHGELVGCFGSHSSQFDQESRDLSHSIVLAPFSEFQESRDIWFQRHTHPRHTPTSGCAADLKLSPDFRKLNDGKYAIQRLAGEYLDRNNPTPSPKPG
ncbi:uncharacterized protein RSE6_14511 [Rhynchosporium secalis]|uniref:Uncharacterized protein n=1 Tax=Rhynchosporium secalis TaxID=38038 RepID=A0A1E1MVG6_RHYSE|nr:uncharacterized protein RSE6_14511 [Rhynchosporium secalis]